MNTDGLVCKVPGLLIVNILRSETTIDIVKAALINTLVRNQQEYKEVIKELQDYLSDYLVQN